MSYKITFGKHKGKTLEEAPLDYVSWIAAFFLGPIDGYEINHIDRDPTNNNVDNLERLTASENQKHWREYGQN